MSAKAKKKGVTNSMGIFIEPKKVAEVMEKHRGERAVAAQELGISIPQLTGMIGGNPALLGRWKRRVIKRSQLVDAIQIGADLLSREPLAQAMGEDTPDKLLPNPEDMKLALQVQKEDKSLREMIKKMGANDQEANLSISFAAFRDRHVQSTLAMTVAGVSLNFQRMLDVLRGLEARLKKAVTGEKPFSMNDHGEPCEEQMVLEAYRSIAEECRRTADFVWRGQIAKAKVEAMIRLGMNATRRGTVNTNTPGFTPKMVKATNKTV